MLTAIPNYLAQSSGQVTAITLIGALLTVFVAFTIWGAIRHPSGPGIVNLMVLLACMYVGWTAARWPGSTRTRGCFSASGTCCSTASAPSGTSSTT